MNEKISWDHSLLKKYNSSNHFKLLSQLRNEVVKYPLIKKKNISSDLIKDNNLQSTNNLIKTSSMDLSLTSNSYIEKEINNNKSTVSFNNSKDFSIYKHNNNDNTVENSKTDFIEGSKTSEELPYSTFKDRLNQIDMK
tara:strand:+ start:289 stop:702 length:414 start_codon:yes stop_codon:yes gene_type:complete